MKKKYTAIISGIVVSIALLLFVGTPLFAQSTSPVPVSSITQFAACPTGSLPSEIFVPWYKYLPDNGKSGRECKAEFPKTQDPNSPIAGDSQGQKTDIVKGITLIAIAIIELLTRVAALIAIGFVIWGGIQYITSQGEPNGLSNAKSTIANALIGLVIVLLAIALVQFVGRALGGSSSGGLPDVQVQSALPNVLRIVFSIVGLLSIIFVAIGGFRYTISGGDPQNTKQAKETILYALIGLAVAVSAFTIIGFVTGKLL